MRLYAGHSKEFIEDATYNKISDKLQAAFFDYYRYNPSPAEIASWRNSLRAMSLVFHDAKLYDHGVFLEFQLPLNSQRLDCIITGQDGKQSDNAVIVELKQWELCEPALGDNEVLTWLGGRKREVLHPSAQVGGYQRYLMDTHTSFYEGDRPVELAACSYLHNYSYRPNDELHSPKFSQHVVSWPIFTKDDVASLSDFLCSRLEKGQGMKVLEKIEQGEYRPNRKLFDHVADVIKSKSEYILLDEQVVVYDRVLASARNLSSDRKAVILVRGGPGTGKSVIAINLMADLLRAGYNTHYATGSKAFTETLRKVIGPRGAPQFKYFNSYVNPDGAKIDVLIADESHRIRQTSDSRFTKKDRRSTASQIEELLEAARVNVFFIDDDQVVRPNEIGSSDLIKAQARQIGAEVAEYQLEAQFRCAGSDGFVNWINNTLGIKRTANVIWDGSDRFDFRIMSSPEELEAEILKKSMEGESTRIVAGFCWNWSDPKEDGTLVDDVVIGDFTKPWNAKPGARGLAKSIPSASLWATDPNGIHQVGCVYTAQGFEFDYVGVIFGQDLIYDFDSNQWIGRKEYSADSTVKRSKDSFTKLIQNTYRVLMSRGLRGCYVYFMDKDTERFFRSRMEGASAGRSRPPLRVEERKAEYSARIKNESKKH